ncbi:SpaA isopeptide-forming pilin-related protein [Enterococcus mundtii]|nr:SpaA isopeptide-forming pilin-related protein [Enterococcus mundtii]
MTTDSDGVAIWHDLLVDTVVTIQEIKAPEGYVLNPTPQTVTVKVNELTSITLANQEQTANLKVIKEDAETGNQPQGGAQLIGAVYKLTDKDGETVAELTMEEVNGSASAELKGLKLGTYYLQETIPPKGYNLDPTIYPIHLTYAGQNETVAVHSKTVTDRVIKGHVEGYKFGSKPLIPTSIFEILHALTSNQTNHKPPLEGIELTATAHTTGKEYVQVTEKTATLNLSIYPMTRIRSLKLKERMAI